MDKEGLFVELMQVALGARGALSECPSEKEWRELFRVCQMQAVAAFAFLALDRLSRAGQKAPVGLVYEWLALIEQVKAQNELMNREAARLTKLFEEAGRKTAILKGQANARLYGSWLKVHGSRLKDDKDRLALLRTPGDIDIWVEGGQESVITLLLNLGLLNERPTIANIGRHDKATESYHHVHLPPTKEGIAVEVHFRPSSGNYCPWTNRRLQDWLEEEIRTVTRVEEGFNVPSIRFALVMQLSHIQRHFLTEGVGMRQICDYYWLLRHSTEEERRAVSGKLGPFGLKRIAGALMWVLREKLHLEEGLLICEPDAWRGKWLLREVMDGGNFGRYADWQQAGLLRWILSKNARYLKLMRFDFQEVAWLEIKYWTNIVKTAPERIKRGKVSLRG